MTPGADFGITLLTFRPLFRNLKEENQVTRKLWMTVGALSLFLAASSAWGNEQNRKDERAQLCKARHAARHQGHSRREAKARSWRQIAEARATVAASDWENSFENLSREVLIVAAELAQTGNHQAAMNLLQRVINAVPEYSDAAVALERIYARAPHTRWDGEESDAFEQECAESTCYQFDFGPSFAAWINCLQQASAPAACN